jgi:hypothetical protein
VIVEEVILELKETAAPSPSRASKNESDISTHPDDGLICVVFLVFSTHLAITWEAKKASKLHMK